MRLLQEFKTFAVRGNVVDMAVGIIMGTAFGKIVSSLVSDILLPPIGLMIGDMDFSDLAITLSAATETTPAVTLGYGMFLQTAIHFTIVAFAVFLLVKGMNTLERKKEAAPAAAAPPAPEVTLLSEIRDLLRESR